MKYNDTGKTLLCAGEDWDKNAPTEFLKYAVGALLYTPANHPTVADDICRGRYPQVKALALCLEDAIGGCDVAAAEQQLVSTLRKLYEALFDGTLSENNLPLLFVRVRSSEQMLRVAADARDFLPVLTGFVLPKFSAESFAAYADALADISAWRSGRSLYVMPIIESGQAIAIENRAQTLLKIREAADQWGECVLNIRVGGNDFCKRFGLRRTYRNTIYDIGVVAGALMDILNVFGRSYVVSGPVWEYFGAEGERWMQGFSRELSLDKLNGFIGKTAIHPSQVLPIQKNMIVEYDDYMDAKAVLEWDSPQTGVLKSPCASRMNELLVHEKWAKKVLALARVYGVAAKEENHAGT